MSTNDQNAKDTSADSLDGLDEIAEELGFPELASGWPDVGSRENLPSPPRHTRQGAGPNQGAREG